MPRNEARSLSGARVMAGWLVDFEAARKQEDVMTRKFGPSINRIAWLSALTLALPAMRLNEGPNLRVMTSSCFRAASKSTSHPTITRAPLSERAS